MARFLILICLSVATLATAADEELPPPVTDSILSSDQRGFKKLSVYANYSYIDLFIPSKLGMTLAYAKSPASVYELDYMQGKIGYDYFGVNLGEIKEQRISLLWRSFAKRDTFNFQMGVHYNKVNVHLGDDLLSQVVPGTDLDYTLMTLETLGVSWGVGNRWQLRNGLTLGGDWFQLHVPLLTLREKTDFIQATSDGDDRDDAKYLVRLVKYFPRVVLLKLQIGFAF